MLHLWAKQAQSGKPTTDDESNEIFGGPKGEHAHLLKKANALAEQRGWKPA